MKSTMLGACCNCGRQGESVRNLLCVDMRSPEPGIGCWGCLTCDLPQAGALAVLCDRCMVVHNATPWNVCLGSPGDDRRMPVSELSEPFEHDAAKHGKIPEPGELDRMMEFAQRVADSIIDDISRDMKKRTRQFEELNLHDRRRKTN